MQTKIKEFQFKKYHIYITKYHNIYTGRWQSALLNEFKIVVVVLFKHILTYIYIYTGRWQSALLNEFKIVVVVLFKHILTF